MKLLAVALVATLTACTNSPPVDNPSAPGSFRPATEQRGEARSLELAEADCAKQGKHAEASRVEGDTVYTCK
jgi:putative hemolysin